MIKVYYLSFYHFTIILKLNKIQLPIIINITWKITETLNLKGLLVLTLVWCNIEFNCKCVSS